MLLLTACGCVCFDFWFYCVGCCGLRFALRVRVVLLVVDVWVYCLLTLF